ncbi:MAG: hypothetical protein JSW00_05060 [Thermoplasmata archaeon]|nr:MAG: hypothetical protein JSW00_05060 [Thermoplasmata archaeon]
MDIKTSEIGKNISQRELKRQCKAVWGGVSWPGERPGFAVVLAMHRIPHFDNHDIYLLDEFETFDMRQLVQQCGVLDFKYQPSRWIGDRRNDAADHFIQDMNNEYTARDYPDTQNLNEYGLPKAEESVNQRRSFCLCPTQLLDMKPLYPCLIYEIKFLLDEKRRQLFLKDSKIKNYMRIEESEQATLEYGAYPAIEALAFTVIEMRRFGQYRDDNYDESKDMELAESYAIKTAFC